MGWLPSLQNLDDDHWKVPAQNSCSYSLEKTQCLYPNIPCGNPCFKILLIGGLEHVLSIQLGMSSSQLLLTPSFFRGVGIPPTSVILYPLQIFYPLQKSRIEMTTSHGISGYQWETCDHSGCLVAQEFSKFRRGHPEAELMGWFIRGWLSQSWRCCYGDMVMKGEFFDQEPPTKKMAVKIPWVYPKLPKKNLRKWSSPQAFSSC